MAEPDPDSYLATSADPTERGLDEIKDWLRGHVTRPDFFTTTPPPALADLQLAIRYATAELDQLLDPQLEACIHAAGDRQHSIELDEYDFWDGRKFDVAALTRVGGGHRLLTLDRRRATQMLELLRDEIAWVTNETRRLELHMKIASELKSSKVRQSFVYRPTPRRPVPFSCARDDSEAATEEGEVDEDAEMLDVEPWETERERRSLGPEREIDEDDSEDEGAACGAEDRCDSPATS
jgi:hypothetical protein